MARSDARISGTLSGSSDIDGGSTAGCGIAGWAYANETRDGDTDDWFSLLPVSMSISAAAVNIAIGEEMLLRVSEDLSLRRSASVSCSSSESRLFEN